MSEAQQTANSEPARNAGRIVPNIETSETIAAMYSTPDPAKKDAPPEPEAKEAKADDAKAKEDKPHDGKKHSFQERISELTQKRKDAEAKAEAAERRAAELDERIKKLEAQPEPAKQEPRPQRSAYPDDDAYIDALAGWKADQAIAKRERDQAAAKAKEAQDSVNEAWGKRLKVAKAEIDDFAEVIGASTVVLPGHIHQSILESEVGPQLAYYFAKNPDEAKRFAAMTPTSALRNLGRLEDQLAEVEEPAKEPTKKAVEVSKAPAPIKPVRDSAPITAPAKSFDEYRAKRQQEMAAKKR